MTKLKMIQIMMMRLTAFMMKKMIKIMMMTLTEILTKMKKIWIMRMPVTVTAVMKKIWALMTSSLKSDTSTPRASIRKDESEQEYLTTTFTLIQALIQFNMIIRYIFLIEKEYILIWINIAYESISYS